MMMTKKFIPEIHDFGKLVDDQVKEIVKKETGKSWSSHVFIDFNFKSFGISQPISSSWWGQYHHKIKNDADINNWNLKDTLGNIPSEKDKYNLFLLILADHLASSVSRTTREDEGEAASQEGVLKLWNKKFYQNENSKGKSWAAFKTKDDLQILFNEIENCQSGEEFLSKYRENLLLTPEDKSAPRNVTSLYMHCELVGKICRVLRKNTKLVKESDGSISIECFGERVKKIKEAEGDNFIYFKDRNGKEHYGNNKGRWQTRLVKCWVKFPHSFVRLHDINLLRKREELINEIATYYKDEVMFATSDFITLFLPFNKDLKEIFKPLLDWGFYIEVKETIADLGILNSILDLKTIKARKNNDMKRLIVLQNRNTRVHRKYLMPEMPSEIQPLICDICQQRRGEERVRETIREWICDKCWDIRNMGEPFREYATTWEEEGVKVCWFKFYLDQKKLEDWLKKALGRYVENIISKLERESMEKEDIKKDIERQKGESESRREELINKVKTIEDKKEIGSEIGKINRKLGDLSSKIRNLQKKINKYKDKIGTFKNYKDEFNPLSLQVDFNKDYKEMLKEFWKKFDGVEDIKKPIGEYDELGVSKYFPELTKMIIENFLNLFEQYFPDCASDESSPKSLSMGIASIKYPIREHWRFFEENNRNFLNIRYHKVFDEKYTKDELKIIVDKAINVKTSSSFLHNLLQLEKRIQSEIYTTIEIFNYRKEYPEIYELFSKGIKPSKFLNLYRLLRG